MCSMSYELYYKIQEFIYKEAELLNEEDYDSWLELLDDDFEYIVVARGLAQDSKTKFEKALFSSDKSKWKTFIERLKSDYGWAYKYAKTITRRIVGNLRVLTTRDSEIKISSSFILIRLEGDEVRWNSQYIISGKREDIMRLYASGELKLCKRTVFIDSPSYPSYNLYFPI